MKILKDSTTPQLQLYISESLNSLTLPTSRSIVYAYVIPHVCVLPSGKTIIHPHVLLREKKNNASSIGACFDGRMNPRRVWEKKGHQRARGKFVHPNGKITLNGNLIVELLFLLFSDCVADMYYSVALCVCRQLLILIMILSSVAWFLELSVLLCRCERMN